MKQVHNYNGKWVLIDWIEPVKVPSNIVAIRMYHEHLGAAISCAIPTLESDADKWKEMEGRQLVKGVDWQYSNFIGYDNNPAIPIQKGDLWRIAKEDAWSDANSNAPITGYKTANELYNAVFDYLKKHYNLTRKV